MQNEQPVAVSVIIPVYNGAALLDQCLQAVLRQDGEWAYEILVVDDGSTDGTAELAASYPVRVLRQRQQGPATARNFGLTHSRGEIIAFTDADCIPARDWLNELITPFDDPWIDGVKGTYRSTQKGLTARFVQLEYEDRYRRMAAFKTIDFIDTYCAAFRKQALQEIGGFDPSFPVPSVEDQELSFRLQEAGKRMVFVPRAVVTHRHADSLFRYMRKKYGIAFWKIKVLRRHPGKAVSDSHTPQILKLQIVLTFLLLAGLIAALIAPVLWPIPMAAVILFTVTTSPFILRSLRRDRTVALLAPFFLFARSLALGVGMAVGLAALPGARR